MDNNEASVKIGPEQGSQSSMEPPCNTTRQEASRPGINAVIICPKTNIYPQLDQAQMWSLIVFSPARRKQQILASLSSLSTCFLCIPHPAVKRKSQIEIFSIHFVVLRTQKITIKLSVVNIVHSRPLLPGSEKLLKSTLN